MPHIASRSLTFVMAVVLIAPAAAQEKPPAPAGAPVSLQRAFVQTYCFGCHNDQRRTAGLSFDRADVDRVGLDPALWEKVVKRLRATLHPPQGSTFPDKGSVSSFIAAITAALDAEEAGRWGPTAARRLTDEELAVRLAAFLWGSAPDADLIAAGMAGTLANPTALEQQVRRMLADPRAQGVLNRVFGASLFLSNMAKVKPDPSVFPDFDDGLREALERETHLFLEAQVKDDAPVTDLVSANYTFVNDRVAAHYGVPDVKGAGFRKITFGDNRRAGLLGEGSVLAITSYAGRTSPVVRAKWIMESFLGVSPPAPPANVPPLRADDPGLTTSGRAKLEQHRKSPVCASCHALMDPIGFALENFDVLGRWRNTDGGAPVDPTGVLADGTPLGGPADLRAALLERRDAFVTTMTTKLLSAAIGRNVEHYDMVAVRDIVAADLADLRWSSVLIGIVKSTPFQMMRLP